MFDPVRFLENSTRQYKKRNPRLVETGIVARISISLLRLGLLEVFQLLFLRSRLQWPGLL